MTLSISRKPHLAKKIVMVGGLDGCGKTLFSQGQITQKIVCDVKNSVLPIEH